MTTERYIEDYASGIRSRRIACPPPDLHEYITAIYEIEHHKMALSAKVKEIIAKTPKKASHEEAERLLDEFIEPIFGNVEFLREIKTRKSHDFLDALHNVRSGPAPEVKMLKSLENLEELWKRAVEDASQTLDKSLEALKNHIVHYQEMLYDLEGLLDQQEGND